VCWLVVWGFSPARALVRDGFPRPRRRRNIPPRLGEGGGGGPTLSHGHVPSSDSFSACATSRTRQRPPASGTPDTPSRRGATLRGGLVARPPSRTVDRGPPSSSGARGP